MTLRQAAFLVASDEVARASDYWWLVYCSHSKLPRSALRKATLEVHAAKMRAARILSTHPGHLPDALRAAIEAKVRSKEV